MKFKETEIGMIPEDWEVNTLDKIAVFKNGKKPPQRDELSYFSVYGSNGVIGKTNKFNSEENTIIIGRVGSYCGSVYFSENKCWVTDNAIIGRSKNSNPIFLFYLLKNLKLNNHKGGSGQPLINQSILYSLKVGVPPLIEQGTVANILSSLDYKIDLNNQMNKNLEQIAQTLFKRWFIDFEFPDENGNPYKSSGGRMVDSELGEIPEGWRVGKLGDISSEKRKNIKVEDINPETPYFGLEHIPRKSISLSDWGSASEVSSNKLIFEKNDILFGKIRPYFHKVGVAPIDGVCSTDIIVISPKEDYYSFVLSIASSEKFVEFATQTSEGTKMPRANWRTLIKYPVVIPDKLTSKRYDEIILTFVEIIQKNIFECKNLSLIRDSLLPKLMSGKIRVKC